MEIGAILFSLAMILLVAAYVLQPLVGSEGGGYRDSGRGLSALQAERDRVLDSIQEIDMDHSMGKVSEQDYQHQRQVLAIEGAEILKSIDELQLSPDAEILRKIDRLQPSPDSEPRGRTPEMELEAAVAEERRKSSTPGPPIAQTSSDSIEEPCPTCGERILHGDRFCSNCGEALEEQVA